MSKKSLKSQLWDNKKIDYYGTVSFSSKYFNFGGYKKMLKYLNASVFLDVGCGDGVKTNQIHKKGHFDKVFGVDYSTRAIKSASAKYKKINFLVGDIEKLPVKDNFANLVYCGFVLEHIDNPKKAINELCRVTKNGGILILHCPNYGAPQRVSPPFKGSRVKTLLRGLIKDTKVFSNKLLWDKVTPIKQTGIHQCDFDTTVEPYINTTIRYLKSKGFSVVESSSLWELDEGKKIYHKILKFLGNNNIYPFKYWGPQMFLVVKK